MTVLQFPNAPPVPRPSIRLGAQVLTYVLTGLLAALILWLTRERPSDLFSQPMAPMWQLMIGQGLALVASALAWFAYRRAAEGDLKLPAVVRYARMDLRGLNPLWIALCAAFSEELLFRAALQPLIGPWFVSLLFLATHIPLVRLRALDRAAWLQLAGIFGASLALGYVFQLVGLLAAMMVHAWIDIVGLLVVRGAVEARRR